MNETCISLVEKDYDIILHNFDKLNLDQFFLETKVRQALMDGLMAMGKNKPKNPINFLGNFLLKFQEWNFEIFYLI